MYGGAYARLHNQDANDFRKHVAIYGPEHEFNRAAYRACNFGRQRGQKYMLDAMSGPGKFGKAMHAAFMNDKRERRRKSLNMVFNDVRPEPLMKLKNEGFETKHCDITDIERIHRHNFHVAGVRFGLKDLPKEKQALAFYSLQRALIPGGRLVVADMYAPSKETQDALIAVHSAKQELAGREKEHEGTCFIPTEQEWMESMEGFFVPVSVVYKGVSIVNTSQWDGQFGYEDREMIDSMNRVIRDICKRWPDFKDEFNVTFQGAEVMLSFPVLVMAGDAK